MSEHEVLFEDSWTTAPGVTTSTSSTGSAMTTIGSSASTPSRSWSLKGACTDLREILKTVGKGAKLPAEAARR